MNPSTYTDLGSTALLVALAGACMRYLLVQLDRREVRIRELETEIKGLNQDASDLLAKRAAVDLATQQNMAELFKRLPGGGS